MTVVMTHGRELKRMIPLDSDGHNIFCIKNKVAELELGGDIIAIAQIPRAQKKFHSQQLSASFSRYVWCQRL